MDRNWSHPGGGGGGGKKFQWRNNNNNRATNVSPGGGHRWEDRNRQSDPFFGANVQPGGGPEHQPLFYYNNPRPYWHHPPRWRDDGHHHFNQHTWNWNHVNKKYQPKKYFKSTATDDVDSGNGLDSSSSDILPSSRPSSPDMSKKSSESSSESQIQIEVKSNAENNVELKSLLEIATINEDSIKLLEEEVVTEAEAEEEINDPAVLREELAKERKKSKVREMELLEKIDRMKMDHQIQINALREEMRAKDEHFSKKDRVEISKAKQEVTDLKFQLVEIKGQHAREMAEVERLAEANPICRENAYNDLKIKWHTSQMVLESLKTELEAYRKCISFRGIFNRNFIPAYDEKTDYTNMPQCIVTDESLIHINDREHEFIGNFGNEEGAQKVINEMRYLQQYYQDRHLYERIQGRMNVSTLITTLQQGHTIGHQFERTIAIGFGITKREATERAIRSAYLDVLDKEAKLEHVSKELI